MIDLFKKIESYRKAADEKLIKKYPFIPYASHHLLMLIFEQQAVNESVMQTDYHRALSLLNKALGLSGKRFQTQVDMINQLKSEKLNQRLLGTY